MKIYRDFTFLFFLCTTGLWGQKDNASNISGTINSSLIKVSTDSIKNTNNNEVTVGISEDNQTVLTYKDDNGNGNLYISRLKGNGFTVPEKVNKAINTSGKEPNEYISADGNIKYFTSNREGGFGGMDIYKSEKLSNGEWSGAINLGSTINTALDERAPFIHTDGITLYFSSNGHTATGNFELFISSLSEHGNWSKPENIGYPAIEIQNKIVNSISSEKAQLVRTSQKNKSKHEHGNNTREANESLNTNYMVTFLNAKQIPLTILKGEITDIHGKVPGHIRIILSDNETGKNLTTYNPDNKSGHYLFILPPVKNINITYLAEGYLFYSVNIDNYYKKKYHKRVGKIQMSPIVPGSKTFLNTIYFDFAKANLRPISNVEINTIFHLLDSNPDLIIEISSYMFSKENGKQNKNISKQRAQAIANSLFDKGINNERIKVKGYIKYKTKEINKNVPFQSTGTNQWLELKIIENKISHKKKINKTDEKNE